MENITPDAQETLNLIMEQNKKIIDQTSTNEYLMKMLLVDSLMDKNIPLINENILCNYKGNIDLDKTILEKYIIKEYNILGNDCILIFPLKEVQFKIMAKDYKNILKQVDKLCILVFDDITAYEKRKCSELNIKFFDMITNKSNIKIR